LCSSLGQLEVEPLTDIVTRPARKNEAQVGARLLFLSGPELFAFSFNQTPAGALQVLTRLWPREAHLFSYQWAHIADLDQQPAGILSCFTRPDLRRASDAMFWAFTRAMWPWDMFRMLANTSDLSSLSPELGADDFYVANVAVLPEARAHGVGHRLMDLADQLARERGCSRCALDVVIENATAQSLYTDCGYRIDETRRSSRLAQRCGFSGMHRMVKDL
jgi:ribosomal protein S18 acetylase RimI-like enzyme